MPNNVYNDNFNLVPQYEIMAGEIDDMNHQQLTALVTLLLQHSNDYSRDRRLIEQFRKSVGLTSPF